MFYTRCLLPQAILTPNSFFTRCLLDQTTFKDPFDNWRPLHQMHFPPNHFYTRCCLHFCTRSLHNKQHTSFMSLCPAYAVCFPRYYTGGSPTWCVITSKFSSRALLHPDQKGDGGAPDCWRLSWFDDTSVFLIYSFNLFQITWSQYFRERASKFWEAHSGPATWQATELVIRCHSWRWPLPSEDISSESLVNVHPSICDTQWIVPGC